MDTFRRCLRDCPPNARVQRYGHEPLDLIWVDTDKSVDPTRKKVRSRLCTREYKTKKPNKIQRALPASHLFSTMAPLEAVKAPLGRAPPRLHTTARELQTCTYHGPGASKTPPKFHERTTKRGKKNENCGGRGKKKSEILGAPAEGGSGGGEVGNTTGLAKTFLKNWPKSNWLKSKKPGLA